MLTLIFMFKCILILNHKLDNYNEKKKNTNDTIAHDIIYHSWVT